MSNEMPEHVVPMGNGGHVCKSCGGMVDAAGYAEGGEVEDDDLADEDGDDRERPSEVGDESTQMIDTERMREFSKALKGGK